MAPRGCAFGKCDDPQCYFCVLMPQKFPPIVPCHPMCRYVRGHRGACRPPDKKPKAQKNTPADLFLEATEDAWFK